MTIVIFLMTSCIRRNNLRLKFENIDSNDIEVSAEELANVKDYSANIKAKFGV